MNLCDRLRDLRSRVFGHRGRAAFARALAISPSTYNYYEKGRCPPAALLARAAEVTGASPDWLLTGRGEPFPQGPTDATDTGLSQQAGKVLDRFARLASGPGETAAARAALRGLLERIERTLPPQPPAWTPSPVAAKPTQVPILGRTAAGILAPWERFFAGHQDPANLDRLLRQVEGRPGRQRSGSLAAADPQTESEATPGDAAPVLIQLSEPTPDGVAEFVDLASLGPAAPGTFALRVDGDSMAPRIRDGDIVVGRRGAPPEPGRTAIVQIRGHIGVTVKLWRPEGDAVHLVPINEAYESARFRRGDVLWACRVLWVVRL